MEGACASKDSFSYLWASTGSLLKVECLCFRPDDVSPESTLYADKFF